MLTELALTHPCDEIVYWSLGRLPRPPGPADHTMPEVPRSSRYPMGPR